MECLGLITTPFFTLQAWFGDLKLKLGAQLLPSKWSSFKNAPLKMYITHAMLAKKVNPEQLIFFHHYYLFYVRKAVNFEIFQNMPQFFYGMVVIGLLCMVGDGWM